MLIQLIDKTQNLTNENHSKKPLQGLETRRGSSAAYGIAVEIAKVAASGVQVVAGIDGQFLLRRGLSTFCVQSQSFTQPKNGPLRPRIKTLHPLHFSQRGFSGSAKTPRSNSSADRLLTKRTLAM